MRPVIAIGKWDEVRVYARKVFWFSWHTGATKVWMLTCLALLSSGCLGRTWYVDKRFTPEEEKEIQTAADQWEAIGAEPLDFVWRQRVDVFDTGRRVIVRCSVRAAVMVAPRYRDVEAEVAANYMKEPGLERILVPTEFVGEGKVKPLGRVIAHEFGHSILGNGYPMNAKGHLDDPRSVMTPYSDVRAPSDVDRHALMLTRQP